MHLAASSMFSCKVSEQRYPPRKQQNQAHPAPMPYKKIEANVNDPTSYGVMTMTISFRQSTTTTSNHNKNFRVR